MAKTLSRSPDAILYEDGCHLWVERQARLLRKGRFDDLDLARLIEDVEDLGANLRNAVTSRTREIILRLLKLQYSPAAEPRGVWQESCSGRRAAGPASGGLSVRVRADHRSDLAARDVHGIKNPVP